MTSFYINYYHPVVKEVLCKDTHRIGRKEVQVEIYRERLGKLSHGDQASVSDISGKTRPEKVKRGTGNVASSIKGAEAQETGQKVETKKPQVGRRVQVQFQGDNNIKPSILQGQFLNSLDHVMKLVKLPIDESTAVLR